MQGTDKRKKSKQEQEIDDVMERVVSRLSGLADEWVAQREAIQKRWLEDLRQYRGVYDLEIFEQLKKLKQSRLFVRNTKQKTDAWIGRITDLLLPNDDKNWGILPTPVQEDPQADQSDASARAKLMETEIEDQLTEAQYHEVVRKIIHDGCLIGSGVIKAPIVQTKPRLVWRKVPEDAVVQGTLPDDAPKPGQWASMEDVSRPRPAVSHVSPWHFFPDPQAGSVEDSGRTFERHMKTKHQMRELASHDGFDRKAIIELLRMGPSDTVPAFMQEVMNLDDNTNVTIEQYTVWEYHGFLEPDEIAEICGCDEEEAILNTDKFIIWFCQGKLLKHGIYPLDSQEPVYSVWNWETVQGSIFGNGVPRAMRDSQAALNAAWRGGLDNAALAVGPVLVVNRSLVEPADGDWELRPRKVFLWKNPDVPIQNAFHLFPIVGNPAVYESLVNRAMQFVDDEVALPLVAQGESGAHQTQTAQGMSMLVNAASVGFKLAVGNFDTSITKPVLRRMYDWNMQHNDREEIKGDYQVDARGSSVLLVREMQSQNLMAMAMNFSGHPVFAKFIKPIDLFRQLVQAFSIPSTAFIKTDEEIAQDEQAEQQAMQSGQVQKSPDQIKAEMQLQVAQLESDTRLKIAELELRFSQLKLATENDMTLKQLDAQVQMGHIKTQAELEKVSAGINHDERTMAAKIAMSEQMGQDFGV